MHHKIQVPQVGKAKDEEEHQRLEHHLPQQKQKAQGPKEERDEQHNNAGHFINTRNVSCVNFIVIGSRRNNPGQETSMDHWLFTVKHLKL